jgi:hypothetical protein
MAMDTDSFLAADAIDMFAPGTILPSQHFAGPSVTPEP